MKHSLAMIYHSKQVFTPSYIFKNLGLHRQSREYCGVWIACGTQSMRFAALQPLSLAASFVNWQRQPHGQVSLAAGLSKCMEHRSLECYKGFYILKKLPVPHKFLMTCHNCILQTWSCLLSGCFSCPALKSLAWRWQSFQS